MSNINIRIIGQANMTQPTAAMAGLQAEIAAANAQLERMIMLQNGVDGKGYSNAAKAAAANSAAFRNAAASTGMFEVQQLKLNKATDDYVKKLKAQKMGFREMARYSKVASAAYKEQIAMEQMRVRQGPGSTLHGRNVVDVVYPKEVSSQLDTASKRLAWMNHQLKSGAHQMVNWGKNTQWAGRQLMVGLTMPVAAFGAVAGVMAYQVDKELTRVAKVYDTTADATSTSVEEMKKVEQELMDLREAGTQTALTAAREYGVAVQDTLKVQAELAAIGQTGDALQAGTTEIMRIARLGEIEYEVATQASITLQSVFKDTIKTTEDLSDAFNYMNSVENATSLATADFAAAIPIAAAPIKAFGGDIKELGILLTAMKERGIEATQGANAIKASLQRLGRPSQQIQDEFRALTGHDIVPLVRSSESLTEVFTKLNRITKDMSDADRRQVFAGLFGTYQVTRMMALTEGMGDLEKGVGQVSDAYQISNQRASEWADTAEREVERYQNSISGRWDTALQEMKGQLATLGEPFVQIATVVLRGISKIIKAFNGLPDLAKWGIAGVVGIAALAGPIVMLAGLMANLTGQFLKGFAGLTGLLVKMEVLDQESRAAKIAAELATAGFVEETHAVQMLTAEVHKLALAQREANAETLARNQSTMPPGQTYMGPTNKSLEQMYFKQQPTHGPGNVAIAADVRLQQARNRLAEEYMLANGQVARDTAKTADNTKQMSAAGKAAAVSGAAMAVSSAVLMFNSNKTVDNIAQYVLVASMIAPALKLVGPLLWAGAKGAGAMAKNIFLALTGAKGLRATLASIRVGLATLMGPVGWILAAVGAVGYGLYKWRQSINEAREEQTRLNNSVNALGDEWAEAAGRAKKEWAGVTLVMGETLKQTKFMEAYEQYTSGDLKKRVDDFKTLTNQDDTSEEEKLTYLREHFMELQVNYGLSEKAAARNVRALLAASGQSLEYQNTIVKQLLENIGEVKQENIGEYLANQIEVVGTKTLRTDEWETAAKDVAEAFVTGFNKNMKPEQAEELLGKFAKAATAEWRNQFKILSQDPSITEAFSILGIESGNALRNAVREAGGMEQFRLGAQEELRGKGYAGLAMDIGRITQALYDADYAERQFFGSAARSASQLGFALEDNIDTFDEFTKHWLVKAQGMNLNQAQKHVKQLKEEMLDTSGPGELIALAERMGSNVGGTAEQMRDIMRAMDAEEAEKFATAITTIAKMRNIKEGEDAVATYFNILKGIENKTKDVESATKRWASAVDFTKDELADIARQGMASVQEEIAETYREDLDSQHEAQMDQRQQYWDNRSEALANEFDARERALDAKWEKRKDEAEAYWDRRVENVEKAIEAEEKAEEKRQKMFDAEIARINKLNEMANQNIDFNVALSEGSFDEAAKIRNDVAAGDVATALERAAGAGSNRSARRVEHLQERQDSIEKAREREMEALEKREEAERRHLDNLREMREEALESQTDASIEALEETQEREKESLEERLDLFLAYTARNKKELKEHMDKVGLSYDKFGEALQRKGLKWAEFFRDTLGKHIREAANELKSDKVWEELGKKSRDEILKGMGFKDWKQFQNFVRTGIMPGKGGQTKGNTETQHSGGVVGDGGSGRKGVARTLRGLHQSEQMVRAQKGEFIVNRNAAERNMDTLHRINAGEEVGDTGDRHGTRRYGKGGPGGPAPMMSGVMAQMFSTGLQAGITKVHDKAEAKHARAAARFAAGEAGMYGDRSFNAEQLRNAAIIANVGKNMGMSARDIMIGIMTAIAESGLINVNYGDRDSLGLFQQRPSMGWGTPAQVTDPEYAARAFFGPLKAHAERHDESPWLAAQHIQRSAFADGSNYRAQWDSAQAIFRKGLSKTKRGDYTPVNYAGGSGGWHRPTPYGTFGGSTHDISVAAGTPVFAVGNGKIIESRYITSGGSPQHPDSFPKVAPNGQLYRSYGEMMKLQTSAGTITYGHLQPNSRLPAGTTVKGGAQIARAGSTGNSSGPHLHLDVGGAYIAKSWLASRGISLDKGAANIKWDNTIANLHRGEAVLTEDLNKKFHQGVENFANGPENHYTIIVNGQGESAEKIADMVMTKIKRNEARKPQSRRGR